MPISPINFARATVPVLVAATRDLALSDLAQGIVQAAAASVAITIPPEAPGLIFDDGFVTTFAVRNAGGTIQILRGAGVTLVSLVDGVDADYEIAATFGIAAIWRLASNVWGIHGSNFTAV